LDEIVIVVRPRQVTRWLVAALAALVLANLAACLWRGPAQMASGAPLWVARLLDMDAERNLPTLFEVALMLGASALLALVGVRAQRRGTADGRYWFFLSGAFAALAVDEAWSFHEHASRVVWATLRLDLPGFLAFAWVLPGMVLVLALLLANLRFLRRQTRFVAAGLVAAGAVFVAGAIGMEMVGAHLSTRAEPSAVLYLLASTLEETLEMAGLILLIRVLLELLADGRGEVRLVLGPAADEARLSGAGRPPAG
jgi:hypothetical protein